MGWRRFAVSLSAISLAAGCTLGPDGTGPPQPLVFPWEGQLGDSGLGTSVAIVLDSNYIDPHDDMELYTLNKSRISVVARREPTGQTAVTILRAVFGMQAPPISNVQLDRPGAWIAVALVDLPRAASLGDPTATEFPFLVTLQVRVDGNVVYEPKVRIVGRTGQPNPIFDSSFAAAWQVNQLLDYQPTIRLRGKRNQGTNQNAFDENWPPIGGVEFDFKHKTICFEAIRAYGSSEASEATGIVGDPFDVSGGYRTVHVALLDAEGIELRYLTSDGMANPDVTLAGTGPFIDLGVDRTRFSNSSCNMSNPANFDILNFRVVDVDGNALLEVADPIVDTEATPAIDATLRFYALDRPAPEGGGGCGIGPELVVAMPILMWLHRRAVGRRRKEPIDERSERADGVR